MKGIQEASGICDATTNERGITIRAEIILRENATRISLQQSASIVCLTKIQARALAKQLVRLAAKLPDKKEST